LGKAFNFLLDINTVLFFNSVTSTPSKCFKVYADRISYYLY